MLVLLIIFLITVPVVVQDLADDRILEVALIAAGLPDVFETTEPADPYEELTIDPAEEIERRGMFVVDPEDQPDFDDRYD